MKYILCAVSAEVLQDILEDYKLKVVSTFASIPDMVSIECDAAVASEVHEDSRVKYVRPNIPNIRKFPSRRTTRWHLTAINRSTPYPVGANYFSYTRQGKGVDIYIVDTGIAYNHMDFEGRAKPLPGWTDPWGNNGGDQDGHGTHVAGLCAGKFSGVAAGAALYSCRVFGPGEEDVATPEQFLTVCDKIILHHESKGGTRPSIVNMSLGASPSYLDPTVYLNDPATDGDDYLDDAVMHLIKNGIQVVVAAGNGFFDDVNMELLGRFNAQYCRPARVNDVITVGALDNDWTIAEYSNYGSCVDVFAPGSYLLSANCNDSMGFIELSGTSMATPVVTGICAQFLESNPTASPAEVKNFIIQTSIKGKLNLAGMEDSDYLLNGGATADGFTLKYVDLNDLETPLSYASGEITPNRVAHSVFIEGGSNIVTGFEGLGSNLVLEDLNA